MYTKYEENPFAEFCWSLIFKIKVMHAYDLGLTPLIHFGLKYIFV